MPFKLVSGDFKTSILSHPMPEIWLSFQDSGTDTIKVEFGKEVQAILERQWKADLVFYYNSEFVDPPDTQNLVNFDLSYEKATSATWIDQRSLTIDAPTGKRKIHQREAESLTLFLSKAAFGVIKEAKRLRSGIKQTF
ncbi:MAG TPA: hypothetical protein VFC63_16440 [Blastocatellia bacterium]|nr:hypothetical protein [Blastocatellia bacterium]